MEDKDRLGEKLRDKGKAAEDLYIAEQERRLREARAQGAAGGPVCPRDGATLKPRTDHGVTIDACPTCGGVWFDKGELSSLIQREGEAAITRWVRTILER